MFVSGTTGCTPLECPVSGKKAQTAHKDALKLVLKRDGILRHEGKTTKRAAIEHLADLCLPPCLD
jgi:hypothetical protein